VNKAKLFKNGNSQAVRLPREFKFQGDEIYVKRIGKLVVLIPEEDPWGSLVQSLDGFSDDFLEERKQPQMEDREPLG
jgi:antitoxin VapB